MYPKGEIYHVYHSQKHGEIKLEAPRGVRIGYGLARGIGAGLIAFALVFLTFSYGPLIKQEILYRFKHPEIVEESGFGQMIDVAEADNVTRIQEEAKEYGVGSYFSIAIPEIGAVSNVTANVDAGNEKEYTTALMQGVAHAKGTYFPGQGQNVYLFAHSTDSPINIARYNAVFYLLRKLEKGDKVIVFFADKKHEYVVETKLVTSADDTSWFSDSGQVERLILQTCDPPGTTWKRLLVIDRPV